MPKLQSAVVSVGMKISPRNTTDSSLLIQDLLETRTQIELAAELEQSTEDLWDHFADEMEAFIASCPSAADVNTVLRGLASAC